MYVSFRKLRFALLASMIFLVGCQTTGSFSEQFVAIEPEQAKLQISDRYRFLSFKRFASATASVYREVWVMEGEPEAVIVAGMLSNQKIWSAPRSESGFISNLRKNNFNKLKDDMDLDRAVPRRITTSSGLGWYFIQDIGARNCVVSMVWSQRNERDADLRYRNLLRSYFCQDEPISMRWAEQWIKGPEFGSEFYDGLGIPDAPLPEV